VADPANVLDRSSLGDSADGCVRRVALSLLGKAQNAAKSVRVSAESGEDDSAADDDSLHDFRVGLRRLRSWLRAFEPSLRRSVKPRHKRRLRSIIRATNSARDASVQVTWMDSHGDDVAETSRAGYDVMRTRLGKQRAEGLERISDALDRFDRLAPKLKRRLEDHTDSFGVVVSEAIVEAADKLDNALSRISHWDDITREHRARIAAKRLRYLIEPVAHLADGGDAIVDSLKSLQDLLGDLHDVQVFSSEIGRAAKKGSDDTKPGLDDLAKRSEDRGRAIYAEIDRDWLNGAADAFFERVRSFARDLSAFHNQQTSGATA
jgi:CHAD domain-containing protein